MFCYRNLAVALSALLLAAFAADDPTGSKKGDASDNPELASLFKADQSSRENFLQFTPEKLEAMVAQDRVRRTRVRELYRSDALKTGADFYHAAMVFQHGDAPEDFLLAHELSVAAVVLGNAQAAWLAAAAEDRFLRSIGRNQRFGTQFGKGPGADDKWQLYPVDEDVPDGLRKVLRCPTLSDAKLREKELNQPASK